jgi:hypothetical protein
MQLEVKAIISTPKSKNKYKMLHFKIKKLSLSSQKQLTKLIAGLVRAISCGESQKKLIQWSKYQKVSALVQFSQKQESEEDL